MDADPRHLLGRRAERLTAWRLWWRGYRILARNWRPQSSHVRGEVDIVARHRGQLVIIEVKSGVDLAGWEPEVHVNYRKQVALCRLLDAWRAEHNTFDVPCRFDVVGVVYKASGRLHDFRVWIDAFEYIDP